ncbi:MAG: hypothetical protein JWN48_2293 [Myxococcaceae bacterium]|nr:hypothetical protein [Myxococcaceae bacterium]
MPRQHSPLLVARVVGWCAALAFFGISTIDQGFYISFVQPFTRVAQGEANLWLASTLLLFPAACLLGYGHHQRIGSALSALHGQLSTMTRRERVLGLTSLTVLAVASARLGNALVLRGFPVTDDELSARFGGEVLASGHLMTRLPFDIAAFPWRYDFMRGQLITSCDWLGVQLAWAFSTLTHSGNWVFALAAATPIPCLAWVLSKRLSPSWGVAGAVIFLASPMAFALSMSSHGQLFSRALVAVTLALFLATRERKTKGISFALGVVLGLGVMCRPFEVSFIMAPLFMSETIAVLRRGDRAEQRRWLVTIVGVAIPVFIFFAHTYALTGGLLPARHHPLLLGGRPTYENSYWVRFGSNSAFNALRLTVWFAGPFGVIAFAAGVLTDRFTRLLGLGVAAVLLLGLFHDNYGIHALGPIHYSECAVVLTLIVVHGLARIRWALRSLGLAFEVPTAVAAVWIVLGLGSFNWFEAEALHDQATTQHDIYELIEELVPPAQRPAVLFAPRFYDLWANTSAFARRRTWVYLWRKPHPDYSDEILILHDGSPAVRASVRAAFPERHFFHMDDRFAIVPESNQ